VDRLARLLTGRRVVDDGNPSTFRGKVTGSVTFADGSKGTITIDGNQKPANGKVDATVTYADGRTGHIKVDALTGQAESQIADVSRPRTMNLAIKAIYSGVSPALIHSLNGYADGGIARAMAAGGVLGMADGGDLGGMGLTPMRSDIAQVVAPNTWRVIGDRMAGDEAFIPINGSARSQSILAQTAGEMGWSLARKSLGGDGASLGTVNLGPLRRALGSTVTSSGSGDVVAAIGRLRDGLQGDIDALREDVRQLQAGKGDVNIDARTYNPAAQTSAESQARAPCGPGRR
jgi:hypothetical protein